jgi:hypothetical protein
MLDSAWVHDVLSLILWWTGLALEFAILFRGLRAKMISRYPYFYAYVLCVFVVSAGLYVGSQLSPGFYNRWYWPTQFVTLVMGCGVLLEILERTLESYAGARRLLRSLCLAFMVAVMCYGAVKVASGTLLSNLGSSAEVERDLRAVQVIFLVAMLAVVSYYRIRFGRNVRGLVLGFGTYVGISMIALAIFAVFGPRFQKIWGHLQSSSYLFALAVWTFALWSYAPNPVPGRGGPDYEELAGQTREKLEALRNHFNRTARP